MNIKQWFIPCFSFVLSFNGYSFIVVLGAAAATVSGVKDRRMSSASSATVAVLPYAPQKRSRFLLNTCHLFVQSGGRKRICMKGDV